MSTRPDVNLYSIAHEHPVGQRVLGDLVADYSVHADALKITDSSAGYLHVGMVVGGYEDCLDVNGKSRNLTVVADLWDIRGKQGFTIKGGSSDITLVGPVRGHGSVTDVDLGNVSDQSDNVTGPVILNLWHEQGPGEPIRVRVLGATRPVIINPSQRYEIDAPVPGFLRSFFLKAYKFLKRLGLPI